jgi:hypothetical protein
MYFAPPHPDDHHFLLRWGGQDRHPSLIVVVDSETGEFTKLEAGTPTHRMRFTKAPDWSVFINSNQDPDRPGVTARVEYVLSLDGTRRRLPPIGGHPDWSPDGKWAAGYKDDGIWLVSHDGTTRREVLHNGAGGHGGFSIATGRWHVGDSPSRGPYADLVYVTEFATGIAIPIAYHGSSYSGWGSGVPDPEATHPAPICSPDETKIVYDSDLLGQPDMWVAVWQRPEAPQDVQFANGSLRWKAPVKHRETAGYVVYRKSDGNWSPVTGLVAGTSMDGLADGTYAVAAREWSGLESGLAMANTNVLVPDCLAPMRPEAPAVIETGETYTVLELPATKEKAFNHYNVYASPDAGTAPSNATLVGSPSDRRFVDWGFETGSARHYRVTVVDSQGNESLPSVASGGETGGDGFGKLRTTTAADGSLHADLPVGSGALRQGTLTMEIQTSRRIGHTARGLATGNLVRSPGIRVSLQETGSGPRFLVQPPGETRKPTAACLFAWLAPEQWYHLAVSWNAETGDVDLFVNGWAQQRLRLPPWKPAEGGGDITLGGLLGKGDDAATIRVRNPELQAWAMDEARLRRSLLGRTFASAGDGVRQGREEPLDLTGLKLTPIFEPDFRKPLPVVHEDDLCKGEQRVREPKPGQWVLEGPASASTKDGELVIDNLATDGTAHTVLWLPEAFPADLLVEYDITIEQPDEGLAILFCAARPAGDPTGSIFKPGLPRRNGVFQSYIKGDIDSYHVSYLSAGERDSAIPGPRRAANVRKNSGFWLVACGDDQIQGRGYGRVPHHVRLLKVGNRLQVEVNGKLSVNFDDDGKTWGTVWGDGYVGLRQMNHLLSARYSGLRVYRVGKE